MKKFNYRIVLYILFMSFIIVGCKKNVDPEPSDHDKKVALIAKTWVVESAANSVTLNGIDEIVNWPNFSVTFTDEKSFTATNISPERLGTVWSASGAWDFKSTTDLNTIVRNDGVEISISVDDTNLTMSFDYTSTGGRKSSIEGLSGIDGAWVFKMKSAQ